MTDIRELLERVKSATGRDQDIDRQIDATLDLKYDFLTRPRFTASVDSALALAERVLPDHRFALYTDGGGKGPTCLAMYEDEPVKAECRAPTLPLAILAALLTALVAQEAAHD